MTGSIDLGSGPYRPTQLASFGSVHGTIDSPRQPPVDSATVVGRKCAGRPLPAAALAKGPTPVIVWIANAPAGKPYPVEKRGDLASDDCVLDPPVQAAIVGTTFNVFNDDKEIHRFVFIPHGTKDTLTVMPFFNAGQVVASERLAKAPGVVDVRCVRHPWMHSYIAVFNHPYFAVTDEKGAFAIDSLPPGNYTMMVWREGMPAPKSQAVQVAANGTATVHLSVQ
ncbi:MAG TPA: carboxypeptidase regulatory-like domain-containing protein [Gemmatimonadaceae bacterium]|nr:carboxypeptidase regulatory-like domain-containing protein [Gemmatimonadaceae bacterium]